MTANPNNADTSISPSASPPTTPSAAASVLTPTTSADIQTAPPTPQRIPSPRLSIESAGFLRSKSFIVESALKRSSETGQASVAANCHQNSSTSSPPLLAGANHTLQSVLNIDDPHESNRLEFDHQSGDVRMHRGTHWFNSTEDDNVPTGTSLPKSIPNRRQHLQWPSRVTPQLTHSQTFDIGMLLASSSDTTAIPAVPLISVRGSNAECAPYSLSSDASTLPFSSSSAATARGSALARFPPELLLHILSYFDPPASDATTAFLSPRSTTAALRSCALVCRWWNMVATELLWRRPRVYEAGRFEKLVRTAELSDPSHAPRASGSDCRPLASYPYASLIHHLSLSQTLSEPHRHATKLSSSLTRLLSLPSLQLTTLDLSFCKGVSNYTLQRAAHSLRHLTSLNLSGGGRSEICVIKLVRECTNLKRLGLGWNEHIGNFCLREVGRWCPQLEWIDLSGCWKVSDGGIMSLISSSVGTSSGSMDSPMSNGDGGMYDGPKLKFLDLSYCTNLTPQGLVAVIDACPLLEVCNVFGCGDAARYLHRVLSLQKSDRPGSGYARRRTDGKLLLVKPGWSDVQFDDPNESVPVQFGFGTFMMNSMPSVAAVAPSIPRTSPSSIVDEPESVRKVRVNVPGFVGFWEGVRA